MKKILLSLLVFSLSLTAAPAKKSVNNLYPDYIITAGLGFAATGWSGLSFAGGFLTGPFEKAQEIYIGADVGLDLLGGFGFSATTLSILATGIYRFKTSNPKWIPYAGVSIGPVISFFSGSFFSIIPGAGGTTGFGFAFLPRGGVEYVISNNFGLNADVKLGIAGWVGFLFKTTINAVFYF